MQNFVSSSHTLQDCVEKEDVDIDEKLLDELCEALPEIFGQDDQPLEKQVCRKGPVENASVIASNEVIISGETVASCEHMPSSQHEQLDDKISVAPSNYSMVNGNYSMGLHYFKDSKTQVSPPICPVEGIELLPPNVSSGWRSLPAFVPRYLPTAYGYLYHPRQRLIEFHRKMGTKPPF